MCMYLAFKEATNRKCNVQVLCFERGPNSSFNVILYYCCCAANTVNKQSYIHASYQVAEMALFEYNE